jgi:hypothetical protein
MMIGIMEFIQEFAKNEWVMNPCIGVEKDNEVGGTTFQKFSYHIERCI